MVPVGDLEGWLEQEGFPRSRNKAKWIVGALGWLNSNALSEASELYRFIEAIHNKLAI
jgi:hypothetical protein